MPLWKLTPIDMENPNWEASTHKGEVIARAETEEKARSLCVSAFRTGATKGHVGAIIPYPPWKYPEHVLCQGGLGSKGAIDDRNAIEKEMSTNAVLEAQRLAREWTEKHGK